MQEGRTKNVGWSIYFDKYRNNLNTLYHTEEESHRLCGSTCCQKSEVIMTHPNKDLIDKVFKRLLQEHNEHNNSKAVKKKEKEILELKKEIWDEHREVLDKATADLKETMLEYFI